MLQNKIKYSSLSVIFVFITFTFSYAQQYNPLNDMHTQVHGVSVDYKLKYEVPAIQTVKKDISKVFMFIKANTNGTLIHYKTLAPIKNYNDINDEYFLEQTNFRLMHYCWGVTYAGLLYTYDVTNDANFKDYVIEKYEIISSLYNYYGDNERTIPKGLDRLINPAHLDDVGALTNAAILSLKYNCENSKLNSLISNYINHISESEYRLNDGTLARNTPTKNTLWLDDLYMSVPALTQAFQYLNDEKYINDAVFQILSFSSRMFIPEKGLYMHAYVEDSEFHPAFCWGRANGWAILATSNLLDVLPKSHKDYNTILELHKRHIYSLSTYQTPSGLWTQLIDKQNSYMETSASAIFTYCIAHAINMGWVEAKNFAPIAILAWNGLESMINDDGSINGGCIGTGVGWDFAFYYNRPTNRFAPHTYGPFFYAGAEIIKLLEKFKFKKQFGAIHLIP